MNQKANILIVDDEEIMRSLFTDLLSEEGTVRAIRALSPFHRDSDDGFLSGYIFGAGLKGRGDNLCPQTV